MQCFAVSTAATCYDISYTDVTRSLSIYSRYHSDEDPRYAHLKAGIVRQVPAFSLYYTTGYNSALCIFRDLPLHYICSSVHPIDGTWGIKFSGCLSVCACVRASGCKHFLTSLPSTSSCLGDCVDALCSDMLREALGVKPNHLPPYIYQMRVCGYPPGHLENARQEMSGLAMFGKHGQGVLLYWVYSYTAYTTFCLVINVIFFGCFLYTCNLLLSLFGMKNV